MVNLCGSLPPEDAQKVAQFLTTFEGPALAAAANPAFAARIAQNTASKPIAAPLLIAQGLTDTVVVPSTDAAPPANGSNTGNSLITTTLVLCGLARRWRNR
jgi:alpha-beta hydrolase superfamily lysophospholipase